MIRVTLNKTNQLRDEVKQDEHMSSNTKLIIDLAKEVKLINGF